MTPNRASLPRITMAENGKSGRLHYPQPCPVPTQCVMGTTPPLVALGPVQNAQEPDQSRWPQFCIAHIIILSRIRQVLSTMVLFLIRQSEFCTELPVSQTHNVFGPSIHPPRINDPGKFALEGKRCRSKRR